MIVLYLTGGLITLVVGAELLVRGASDIAARLRVPAIIVGLTIVAYGTSAPELAVSTAAAFHGDASIALGNVVGSNIFNVFFILGLSSVILPLTVSFKLIRFDVPVMIGTSIAGLLICADGLIDRRDGVILLSLLILYSLWCLLEGVRETREMRRSETAGRIETLPHAAADLTGTAEPAPLQNPAAGMHGRSFFRDVSLIGLGLVMLVVGADWLVHGASRTARYFGVSELVIGLTVVAAGTSLPELATSVVAAFRKQVDLAVGNVVGSNIFNLLGVLGTAAVCDPTGIAVERATLEFDFLVMIAAACACLPIFFTGLRINRTEGVLLLGWYLLYTVNLILDSAGSPVSTALKFATLGIAVPVSAVFLTLSSIIELRQKLIVISDRCRNPDLWKELEGRIPENEATVPENGSDGEAS